MPRIRTGTASWSDPGFIAHWYPRDLPSTHRLAWYAEHFDLVEVNASFYAIPTRFIMRRWAAQTPEGFLFDMKLHRLLSRHRTSLRDLPTALRSLARMDGSWVLPTEELEAAMAHYFLQELAPLMATDKLGTLLLQLSPVFGPHSHRLSELDHLLHLLSGQSVAVELRHRGWLMEERIDETARYFQKHKVTLVSVDTPASTHFTVMPRADIITNPRLLYLRAHGRDKEAFVRGRTVAERFKYKYNDAELTEIADRMLGVAREESEVHVIFNNNYGNYAPLAAERFKEIAAERQKQRAQAKKQQTPIPQKKTLPTSRQETPAKEKEPEHASRRA